MRALQAIRLRGPDQRDQAREMVGIARRHTLVVFIRPMVVGVVVAAAAVLLMLAAAGLAR